MRGHDLHPFRGYPEDRERLDRRTRRAVAEEVTVGVEPEPLFEQMQARDALQQAVGVVVLAGPQAHRHAVELLEPDRQRIRSIRDHRTRVAGPERSGLEEQLGRVGADLRSLAAHDAAGNLHDAVTSRRRAVEMRQRRERRWPHPTGRRGHGVGDRFQLAVARARRSGGRLRRGRLHRSRPQSGDAARSARGRRASPASR